MDKGRKPPTTKVGPMRAKRIVTLPPIGLEIHYCLVEDSKRVTTTNLHNVPLAVGLKQIVKSYYTNEYAVAKIIFYLLKSAI